jgi:hypothetical protein
MGEPWPPAVTSDEAAGSLRRRRRWLVVLAVVLVAGGGVANTLLWAGQGERVAVLAVARPVPWMQQVSDADVVVVRLAADPGIASIAASQRGQVIGMRAAGNLAPGMLLSPGLVSDTTLPGVGQQLVSVPLRPEVLPARGLRPGDAVLVVVGGAGVAGGGGERPASGGVAGRVAQVGAPAADGGVTVDVAVPDAAGPGLAAALVSVGAERRVALVVLPAGS